MTDRREDLFRPVLAAGLLLIAVAVTVLGTEPAPRAEVEAGTSAADLQAFMDEIPDAAFATSTASVVHENLIDTSSGKLTFNGAADVTLSASSGPAFPALALSGGIEIGRFTDEDGDGLYDRLGLMHEGEEQRVLVYDEDRGWVQR